MVNFISGGSGSVHYLAVLRYAAKRMRHACLHASFREKGRFVDEVCDPHNFFRAMVLRRRACRLLAVLLECGYAHTNWIVKHSAHPQSS